MRTHQLVEYAQRARRQPEVLSIFTVPESKVKPEEPWSPSLLYVDKVLDHRNIYIAPWSKKQIKFISYVTSMLHLMERYIRVPHTWIKALVHEYMSLSKYENGKLIKSAENVARSHGMKTFMQLSRLKRMLVGGEE